MFLLSSHIQCLLWSHLNQFFWPCHSSQFCMKTIFVYFTTVASLQWSIQELCLLFSHIKAHSHTVILLRPATNAVHCIKNRKFPIIHNVLHQLLVTAELLQCEQAFNLVGVTIVGNGYQTGVNYDRLRDELGQARELQEVGPTTSMSPGPDGKNKRDDLLYFSI